MALILIKKEPQKPHRLFVVAVDFFVMFYLINKGL
jgi:hypothetical protein